MNFLSLFELFIQTDPGVPVVYAGFGALMITTCISYLSHSQVNFLSLFEFDHFFSMLLLLICSSFFTSDNYFFV